MISANTKRKVKEVSPEQINSKRCDMGLSKEEYTTIMSDLLDAKLQNVATKDDIATVKVDIAVLSEECKQLKEAAEISRRKEQMLAIELKTIQMHIRKNNLIFRGVKSSADPVQRQQIVVDFCKTKLGVNVVDIQRTIQLGKNNVILAEFNKDSCVQDILQNTSKLKGSMVSIQRDMPPKMRAARNVLLWLRKQLIAKNETIAYKLRWDELILNGCVFGLADDGTLLFNGECGGVVKLSAIMQMDCSNLERDLKKMVKNNNKL